MGSLRIIRDTAHFATSSVSSHPGLLAMAPSQTMSPGIVMRVILGTEFGLGFPFGAEFPLPFPQSKLHHS